MTTYTLNVKRRTSCFPIQSKMNNIKDGIKRIIILLVQTFLVYIIVIPFLQISVAFPY